MQKFFKLNVIFASLLRCIFVFGCASAFGGSTELVIICSKCDFDQAASASLSIGFAEPAVKVQVLDFDEEIIRTFLVRTELKSSAVSRTAKLVQTDGQVNKQFDDWLTVKRIPSITGYKVGGAFGNYSADQLKVNSQIRNKIAEQLHAELKSILNFPVQLLSDQFNQLSYTALAYFGKTKSIRVNVIFLDESVAPFDLHFKLFLDQTDVRFKYAGPIE